MCFICNLTEQHRDEINALVDRLMRESRDQIIRAQHEHAEKFGEERIVDLSEEDDALEKMGSLVLSRILFARFFAVIGDDYNLLIGLLEPSMHKAGFTTPADSIGKMFDDLLDDLFAEQPQAPVTSHKPINEGHGD